jgi:hypothetical protein
MTLAERIRRGAAAVCGVGVLLGALLVPARAGTVWTLDGKTYEGETRLEIPDGLVVAPKTGQPIKVPIKNVLFAAVGQPQLPDAATAGNLPGQFKGRDIGNVAKPGLVTFLQGNFSIRATGTESNRLQDAFHYTFVTFHLEGSIMAHVTDLNPAQKDMTARAGLMFRATTDPAAYFASLTVNPAGDVEFRCRYAERGEAVVVGTKKAKLPIWLRLTRIHQGKDFIGEWSEDGRRWDEVGRTGGSAPTPLPDIRQPGRIGRGVPLTTMPGRVPPRTQPARPLPATAPATIPAAVPPPAASNLPPAIPMGPLCYAGLMLVGGNSGQPAAAAIEAVTIRESYGGVFQTDSSSNEQLSFVSTPIELVGRGILLKSGSYFANAEILDSDSTRLKFAYAGIKLSAPYAQIARITMEPLSAGLLARVPSDRMGVLSRTGDFMEGEINSIEAGKEGREVLLSSVIFGLTRFRLDNGTTSAVVLREPSPADAAYRVVLIDGSVLLAESLKAEADRLIINERTVGAMAIPIRQVFIVRASSERAASLTTFKPSKVDGPDTNFDPAAISLFDKNQWTWLLLPGGASPGGIVSPGATAISYDLDGKYKSFVCRVGIPERVSSRVSGKFVVLADGKEVFSSKPLSSKDAATTITVPLAGAKTVTLKLDCDPGVERALFGLWGDPMLVK